MSNFVDGVIGGVKTAFCTFINIGDSGTSFFNELSPLPDIPSYGPFWNRVLCDRNEPLPEAPPPFTGGQCPGVAYRPQVRETDGGWTTVISSLVYGPISRFERRSPDAFTFEVDGFLQDGSPGTFISPTIVDRALPVEKRIIRADGQPDTCGDPPPIIPPFPPSGDTVDIDITYTNNEGDTVVELGDLTIFAPVIIAPVNIVAPIRVELPDVSFDGQIVLAPRFDVILNPPASSDGPGEEGGDGEQPQPDDEKELIGVRVITPNPSAGGATVIFGMGSAPNLYVPRLATAQYELLFDGVSTWTDPVDIKTDNQFVPAPRDGVVLRFVINNIPGVSSVGRPVFIPEQPRCCV